MKALVGVLTILVTATIVSSKYAMQLKTIKRPTGTIIVKCKHYLKKVPYSYYGRVEGDLKIICDDDYYTPQIIKINSLNPTNMHPKLYLHNNITRIRSFLLPQMAYNYATNEIKRIKRIKRSSTGTDKSKQKLKWGKEALTHAKTSEAKPSANFEKALGDLRRAVKSALSIGFDDAKADPASLETRMATYNEELDTTLTKLGSLFSKSLRDKPSIRKGRKQILPPTRMQLKKRKNGSDKSKLTKVGTPWRHKSVIRRKRLTSANEGLIEEYPYVVSIQKDGEHWCSGVLLNPRLVLTTANCMWKTTTKTFMRIRACSRYTNAGGQKAKIVEVLKHPDWNIRSFPDNDIALLLLDHSLKFSATCHAADLPNRYMRPPFQDAWVTSWGSERRDGRFLEGGSETLQVYHGFLMDKEKCKNATLRFGVAVTDNFICMLQRGKRAPCTRDTGAPAVSDGVVWGLASWGIRKRCGTERYPAMFTYTAADSILNFIIAGTKKLMSDYRESPFWGASRNPSLPSFQVPQEPYDLQKKEDVLEKIHHGYKGKPL